MIVGRRLVARALFLSLAALGPTAAGAAPESEAESSRAIDGGAGAETGPVDVIVITDAGVCPPSLRDVIAERLADVTADLVWRCRQRPDPEEAFPAAHATGAIRISIDLRATAEARLLLGDARSDRFVVRRVPLPSGLDELGREQLGQIIRFATLALRSSSNGTLSRTEARAAVASWPSPGTRAPPPSEPAPRAPRVAIGIGPSWSVSAFSREIPAVHELALDVDVRHLASGVLGWVEGGYRLPARYATEPIGVELTAASLRAGIGVGQAGARRLSFRAGAGVGLQRVWYAPVGAAGSVAPAASGSFWNAGARVLVGGDLRATPALTIGARLICDIGAEDVHYDLRGANGEVRRVLTAYRVAPGLGIAVAWRF